MGGLQHLWYSVQLTVGGFRRLFFRACGHIYFHQHTSILPSWKPEHVILSSQYSGFIDVELTL
jgi:hypothetical protein